MERFETQLEQPKIKNVEKLSDWTVLIPYTKETSVWWIIEFDFRVKQEKDGKVFIENKTPITESNKWYIHSQEKYELDVSDSKAFAKSLWKALDNYIGTGRPSLSQEKWEEAYQLLWFEEQLVLEKIKKESEALKKEIEAIQNDKDLERNADTKTLKFEYNIGYWAPEKIIYATLKDLNEEKVQFKMEAGFLYSIAGLTTIEKTFKKSELQNQLPKFVDQSFRDGIIYKRFFWLIKEKDVPRDRVIDNAVQKATKAAKAFKLYTDK